MGLPDYGILGVVNAEVFWTMNEVSIVEHETLCQGRSLKSIQNKPVGCRGPNCNQSSVCPNTGVWAHRLVIPYVFCQRSFVSRLIRDHGPGCVIRKIRGDWQVGVDDLEEPSRLNTFKVTHTEMQLGRVGHEAC